MGIRTLSVMVLLIIFFRMAKFIWEHNYPSGIQTPDSFGVSLKAMTTTDNIADIRIEIVLIDFKGLEHVLIPKEINLGENDWQKIYWSRNEISWEEVDSFFCIQLKFMPLSTATLPIGVKSIHGRQLGDSLSGCGYNL
jgi:hypothetical protein